jgi:hypothetical protein
MGLARYAIIAVGPRRDIFTMAMLKADHATKESAFEAAVACWRSAKGTRPMSAYQGAMKGTGTATGARNDA